jgi:hypothetical protein
MDALHNGCIGGDTIAFMQFQDVARYYLTA